MIPGFLPRLGVAALLCALSPLALAQEEPKQRSRTEPKRQEAPAQPAPRGSAPAAPQKGSAAQQKPDPAGGQQKGSPSTRKPDPAANQQKGSATTGKPAPAAPASPGPGGAKATLLATFNDWGAYASGEGRAKVCYALSRPKERLPNDLKRDPAYLFVSFRPADNVRNEIAVVLGFATRDGGEAEAVVGQSTYAFVTKGTNAWVRNTSEESQIIAAFTKGQSVTVKATSGRGNASTDRYSLLGFGQALERARQECS
jgi:hypothetical protein